ncbi:MAG: hypothetical protein K0S37_1242 [Microbacterium sp.]|jgi:hypothetical protein|nr:hypothetical protein [Microbacterium sp.]
MRYSVDATGVAAVMFDVAACFDDVIAAVTQTLTSADDAAATLRADASGVLRALEAVFSPRRQSGPGIAAYAGEVARKLQDATIAFVAGDDEMAAQTTATAQGVLPLTRRGFGAVAF